MFSPCTLPRAKSAPRCGQRASCTTALPDLVRYTTRRWPSRVADCGVARSALRATGNHWRRMACSARWRWGSAVVMVASSRLFLVLRSDTNDQRATIDRQRLAGDERGFVGGEKGHGGGDFLGMDQAAQGDVGLLALD